MKILQKIKRIVSLALTLALLGTAVMTLSSCGLFAKNVKGTEAAKILLARERLDAEYIGQKFSMFSYEQEEEETSFWEGLFPFGSISARPLISLKNDVLPGSVGLTVDDTTVEWSTFPEYSSLKESYKQFIDPIDESAAQTAELIAYTKERVGTTDVWVDTMYAKYMLLVDENSEILIEYYKPYDSVSLSIRYTTEDAKNVYEMYSFMKYDDGTTGDIRNKCIPGEYYEYTYINSGGFKDYFIAERTRGYWVTNRFSIHDYGVSNHISVLKDEVGYESYISVMEEDDHLVSNTDYSVALFLPNTGGDLYGISGGSGRYSITLYMSNVESGIDSIVAEKEYTRSEEYGGSGLVYLSRDDISRQYAPDIKLSNGKTLKGGSLSDSVTYESAHISYSPEYHGDCYVGELYFDVKAESVDAALEELENCLNANGIKVRSNRAEVLEGYEHGHLLFDNFDLTEWYGYTFESRENLLAAEQCLIDDFATFRAVYEENKDNETVVLKRDVSAFLNFGDIELLSSGNVTYANGIISVSGLEAKTGKSDVFEDGESYTLKVGLALRDDEGNISSVNTVSLKSSNEATVTYNGEALSMSQTADYVVPKALDEGEYVVVLYFATADEGIRVTEMLPLAFYSAEEGKLDSSVMDVTVKKVDNKLYIDYEVKLSDFVETDLKKDSYTYEEIRKILMRGVLNKGYPQTGAVVQTENGEALSESGSYGSGVYRLKYLVNTHEGLVEAYMYCQL